MTQTEAKFGEVETSLYTDDNQDGVFQKAFELDVLTGTNTRSLETVQFKGSDGASLTGDSVLPGDPIASMLELTRRGWKIDRLDANETLDAVDVGGDTYIVQTHTQWNGAVDFSIYRDGDVDGRWTEIAEGKSHDLFLTLDGQIDLVGLVEAGLLPSADVLLG